MALDDLFDSKGRAVRALVGNESEDGTGAWHAIVTDSSGYPKVKIQSIGADLTWSVAQTGMTLTSPTINGTIATTGLTLPAVTLGGVVTAYAGSGIVRTATKVVAASDADATVKLQADYVCDGVADDVEIQAAIDAGGTNGSVTCIGSTWNTTTAITADVDGLILEIQGTLKPAGAINGIEMTGQRMDIYVREIDGTDNAPSGILNKSSRFCTIRFQTIKNCNYGIAVGDPAVDALTADNTWIGNDVRDNLYGITLQGCSELGHAQGQTLLINFVVNSLVAPTQMLWAKQNCQFTIFTGSIDNLYTGSTVKELKDDCGYSTWNIGYFTSFDDVTLGSHSSFMSPTYTVVTAPIIPLGLTTIADGNLTISRGFHSVETEAGAATDNLDNILGGIEGQILVLREINIAHVVTVRNKAVGTGNIRLSNARDFTLRETSSSITFIKIGTIWAELARSYAGNVIYQNSGTATVANGQTTVVVTHGLATTPTRVFLTATLWSNAAKAWVTTLTATQFTINVDADPGAGTAIFDWRAQVGEG